MTTYPRSSDPLSALAKPSGPTEAHSLWHGRTLNVFENVMAHGATGDNATDDTAAFNAARAALPVTGGIVYAPPPSVKYLISASLNPYTANQSFVGAGQTATKIRFTGTGYCFSFGSVSDPALTYGCSCSNFSLQLTNNAGHGLRFAGTAMGRPENIYIEGVPSTNSSIGVMWDGGLAANIFGAPQNIICNHIKYGHVMDQSNPAGYVTSLNARNCTAYGDDMAGSRGWDIRTAVGIFNNGSGSHIIGGNVENCERGISVDGVGITWDGLRFESNTTDVYTNTNARGNLYRGFQGADTWSDVPTEYSNQRIGCTQSDNTPLQDLRAAMYSEGNLVLGNVPASTRYILSGNRAAPGGLNASNGRLVTQWGAGSASDGGATILYGASHASKPGYVVAGIGSPTGKFEVNSEALDGGAVILRADPVLADGETGLLIYRRVGGVYTLQRVSMGAADSGGSGYKVLRVPN